MKRLIVIAALLLVVGCKSKSNNSPTPIPETQLLDVVGRWAGIYSTNITKDKQAVITMEQNMADISGTFSIDEGDFALEGMVSVEMLSWSVMLDIDTCPGAFTGTAVRNGSLLHATIRGSDCRGDHVGAGTFELQP